METKKHWFADVEEDPETGDLVMIFPPGMLEELGWTQGDMLVWDVADNGDVSLKKKIER